MLRIIYIFYIMMINIMIQKLPDELIHLINHFNDNLEKIRFVFICKHIFSICNDVTAQKLYHIKYLNTTYGVDMTFNQIETVEQAKLYFHLVQPHIWHEWSYRTINKPKSNELQLFITEVLMNYYREVINGNYVKHQSVIYGAEGLLPW